MSACGIVARPGALPTLMRSAAGRGQIEQAGDRQPVVDDDVGPAEHLGPAHGQQPGITGSGTHQVDGHRSSLGMPPGPPIPRCSGRGVTVGHGANDCTADATRVARCSHDQSPAPSPRSPRAERARASIAEALLSLHRRGRPPADGQPHRRASRHLAAADLPPLRRPRIALPGGLAHPAQAPARAVRPGATRPALRRATHRVRRAAGPASTSGRRRCAARP